MLLMLSISKGSLIPSEMSGISYVYALELNLIMMNIPLTNCCCWCQKLWALHSKLAKSRAFRLLWLRSTYNHQGRSESTNFLSIKWGLLMLRTEDDPDNRLAYKLVSKNLGQLNSGMSLLWNMFSYHENVFKHLKHWLLIWGCYFNHVYSLNSGKNQ